MFRVLSSAALAAVMTVACALPTEGLTAGRDAQPETLATGATSASTPNDQSSPIELGTSPDSADPELEDVADTLGGAPTEVAASSRDTILASLQEQADAVVASEDEMALDDATARATDSGADETSTEPKSEEGSSKQESSTQDSPDVGANAEDPQVDSTEEGVASDTVGETDEVLDDAGDTTASEVPLTGLTETTPPLYCEGPECGLCRGTCSGAGCAALELASDIGSVTSTEQRLALLGESLLWVNANQDSIEMLDPDVAGVQFVTAQPGVLALAVDEGTDLYFMTSNTLHTCALDNCESRQLAQSNGFAPPIFRIHDGDIYMFEDLGLESHMATCRKQDCINFPTEIARAYSATSMAWSGDTLFFTDRNAGNSGRGRIFALGAQTPPASVVVAQASPDSLHVAGGYLYWAENSFAGSVKRCALNGAECAEIETLAGNFVGGEQVRFPSGVQVRGDRVIWSNGGPSGAIFSCPASGCSEDVRKLVSLTVDPSALRLSEHCAFWIDGFGSVWTQALP